MKVIDLLNKIANGEEVPENIKAFGEKFNYDGYDYYSFHSSSPLMSYVGEDYLRAEMNYEVEIIEEEKKIPEKHINNYGDLIILGQQDNWLEPTIETDQKINAQLNPYVFEAINENFKDIENKIYEIIDYLESKGE